MGKNKIILILFWTPIALLALINLFTVFVPELGFDALWYHLTLPKLWLDKNQWYFPGGLLYYSAMPRLSELIFTPLLPVFSWVGPKFIQFISGMGTGFIIYKITGKLKFPEIFKVAAVSLFYCTFLVSWQSGSAYIDLIRTFFETLCLYYLLTKKKILPGIFIGLAIGTKWLSLGSLAIYSLVFGPSLIIPALIVSLPWFIIAYIFTGNPVFPMFEPFLENSLASIGEIVKHWIFSPYFLTRPFDDYISPVVGILFTIAVFTIIFKKNLERKIGLVGLLGVLFSFALVPPSSRYALPYLPAIIIASLSLIISFKKNISGIFLTVFLLSSMTILLLRLLTFQKYIPYLKGYTGLNGFLFSQSGRLGGTYIDVDNTIENIISKNDKVLIGNIHNLFYFPYGFDHTSWVESSEGYDYYVTKDENPYSINGNLVYTNPLGIQIFKLNNQ